jgi:hypothetical protein
MARQGRLHHEDLVAILVYLSYTRLYLGSIKGILLYEYRYDAPGYKTVCLSNLDSPFQIVILLCEFRYMDSRDSDDVPENGNRAEMRYNMAHRSNDTRECRHGNDVTNLISCSFWPHMYTIDNTPQPSLMIYSSPYSSRPSFEFRYSFLRGKSQSTFFALFPTLPHSTPCDFCVGCTHLSIAHCMIS